MNTLIAGMTVRGMLGRRRFLLLVALPAVLLALAGAIRVAGVADDQTGAMLLQRFGLATVVPLLALIAGTGVIGPEIDDGEIIYLLTKPIPRPVITTSKLVVAIAVTVVFAVLPLLAAGLVSVGTSNRLAVAFATGALVAAVAYCALFLALAVATRAAVVAGLVYALVWEGLIGNYVPRARVLSIQQWSMSVTAGIAQGDVVHSDVGLPVAATLLAIVTLGAAVYAGQRLRSLTLAGEA